MISLYFILMDYPINLIVDSLLNKNLDKGIKNVESTTYSIKLTFNNDIIARFYDINKYSSWFSKGSIGTYAFEHGRPKRKTMCRFIKALKDYYIKTNS